MSKSTLSRQQQQDRLSVSRAVMKWQPGLQSELTSDEIIIDATCDQRSRMLDQLSFSHALQRHMKLLLLEEEMDRILSSVKRIVRQDRSIVIRRFLPLSLGGLESGARTMQVSEFIPACQHLVEPDVRGVTHLCLRSVFCSCANSTSTTV